MLLVGSEDELESESEPESDLESEEESVSELAPEPASELASEPESEAGSDDFCSLLPPGPPPCSMVSAVRHAAIRSYPLLS